MSNKNNNARIQLIEEEHNIDTGMHTVVLRLPQRDCTFCEIRIPRADLSDPKKMRNLLLNKGCPDFPDLKKQASQILASTPPRIVQTTAVSGWYKDQVVTKYGTFTAIHEDKSYKSVQFDKSHPYYTDHFSVGSHLVYKKQIKPIIERSSYLTFFIAAALAPALADRIGLSGAYGFNLSGKSSTGKTLTLRLCQSVYSRARDQDLASFGDTTGYILANLSAYGAVCIPFSDPKATREKSKSLCEKMQTIIFSAHDGVQRQGLTNDSVLPSRFSISLFNSERPLFEIFAEAGCTYEVGEMVRLIDIPVPTKNGIFDKLATGEKASDYARNLEEVIENNYGVLFPEWVNFLAQQDVEKLKFRFEILERQFLAEACKFGKSSEERRMAKAFALVAITICFSRKEGLLPKGKRSPGKIAMSLFKKACIRMTKSGVENTSANSNFKVFMKASENLPLVQPGEKVQPDTAINGFIRKEQEGNFLYVKRSFFSAFFENENLLEKSFLPYLQKKGHYINSKMVGLLQFSRMAHQSKGI